MVHYANTNMTVFYKSNVLEFYRNIMSLLEYFYILKMITFTLKSK